MGLETGTTISQLDSTWPLGGDQVSSVDNHARLIKSILKTQFPGAGGLGFNTPIITTEAELNAIHNKVLDAFPSGTKIPFYQATPPVGWTLANPGTNYTLVSAGAGGTIGGGAGRNDNLVTGCTVVPDHQHAQQGTFTTGVSNQSLNHNHSLNGAVGVHAYFGVSVGKSLPNSGPNDFAISTAGGIAGTGLSDLTSHNHNVTISGQTSNVNAGAGATNAIGTWQPQYALVVIGSKT
jgi:hypothetical protein